MEEKNLIYVPVEVYNYIRYLKENNYTLIGALKVCIGEGETKKFMNDYFSISSNQEKFALAWINGCKVEEKLYRVKINNIVEIYSYLNMEEERGTFYFSSQREIEGYKTKFTKEELEKAGFSWLFDCEGVELIEVEE